MPAVYTPNELVELDNAIRDASARADDLSTRLNDLRESSKPVDASAWEMALYDFSAAERQLTHLRSKRDDAVSIGGDRHAIRRTLEEDPFARFVAAAAKTGAGRNGLEGWEIDEQKALLSDSKFASVQKPGDMVIPIRQNATLTTTTAAGAIPTNTSSIIVEALSQYGGARKMSQSLTTPHGQPFQFPKIDESAAVGELVSTQGTAASELTPATFGHTEVGAFTFSSKSVPISREAVQDAVAGFDLIQWSLRQAIRRIGRATNGYFTTGTGTNQPEGFLTKAPVGHTTAAGGGADYMTYADLVEMVYSIDDAYLEGMEMPPGGSASLGSGRVGWQMHRNYEAVLMKMLDGDSRPLWAPGLSSISGNPRQNMLLGYPYVLNFSLPSSTARNTTGGMVFGSFDYHIIRDVDAVLVRLFDDFSTAQNNEVAVLGWARCDSRYIGTGATANEFKSLKTKDAAAG